MATDIEFGMASVSFKKNDEIALTYDWLAIRRCAIEKRSEYPPFPLVMEVWRCPLLKVARRDSLQRGQFRQIPEHSLAIPSEWRASSRWQSGFELPPGNASSFTMSNSSRVASAPVHDT
jgi:hypothetical protein